MFKTVAIKIILTLILTLTLITSLYAAPQQSDYCYLPPFVTAPNTPPNVMVTLDKTSWGMNRAYKSSYDSTKGYYGFFDSSSRYEWKTAGYFEKNDACTPTSANNYNCFPGGLLDWALMSSLDLTKKAMAGYGFVSTSQNAGDLFTYTGDLTAKGLVNAASMGVCNISFAGGNYSYYFIITNPTAANNKPAKVTINVKPYTVPADCLTSSACSGTCLTPVSSQEIGMHYTDESRIGIYQKYADKNSDLYDDYPASGARFGMVRWKTGSGGDKGIEIFDDSLSVTAANKTEFFKSFLNVTSSSPPTDTGTGYLGSMMHDIVNYFSNNATYATHSSDSLAYTQSPYDWSKDSAPSCRKNFALFITSGANLTDASPLSSTCPNNTDTYRTAFSQNACYGYTTDLSAAVSGKQNVRTYVVHTVSGITCTASKCTHNNSACTTDEDCTNEEKLKLAASVSGGEYIKVDDSTKLQSKIEEAILNIIGTSASASTVATLTTQTRESSTLTQAYFYPKRENTPLRWLGYLRLLWSDSGANLREDTLNTGWLDLKKDNILSFYYDPALVAYKGRTFAVKNESPYLTIDTCDPSDSKVTTKLNENILTIWNAQDKLLARSPTDRNIKIGIGDTSTADGKAGKVSSSTCTSFVEGGKTKYSGFCDFKTTPNTPNLADTLQPFWNYASYCSNYTSRWCAQNLDCNRCTANPGTRSCPNGTSAECNYCGGNTALACSTTLTCTDTGFVGSCTNAGDTCGSGKCVGDCYKYYGTCTTGSLVCNDNYTTDCTAKGLGNPCDSGATCVRNCSLDTSKFCFGDAAGQGCIDDYHGTTLLSGCVTSDTCITGDTCNPECDTNCAASVIKFGRGYDKPSYSGTASTSPGSFYRDRTQCAADTDCPGGSCGSKVCSNAPTTSCSSDAGCISPGKCYGTCSSTSYDITKTLKLGDIVYSTPRISPNSAVNGYDVTYSDNSYKNFKGSNTVKNATPIVIVGANDGMVHAFQVSKIKDLSPASLTSGSDTTSGSGDGSYQTARFSDYPPTSDSAPPSDIGKELWAYIPFNAVPYLKWYCDESYCHIPMVDARFTVVDAAIDYDADGTVESTEGKSAIDDRTCNADGTNCVWRRLLIGAMGVGGRQITVGSNTWSSSVFVLDITNPASPTLLWERPLPDGTLTTGTPAVIRLASATTEAAKNENGKWYLVIGSGPTSIATNTVNYTTGNANIYVFDLRNGDLKATLSTGATGVAVADLMAVDMDSDYQVDDIYFGTYGGTGAAGKGKLYRLAIRNDPDVNTKSYQTTPSDWDISAVVVPGGGDGRPIYASPEIAQDALGNIWLYFGTGVYLSAEHATSPAPNEYLYGFKESAACWKGMSSCSTYTKFLNSTGITLSGAKATELGCFCAGNLISTISCPTAGTCSSCGAGLDTVVTKVTDATLSGYSGTGASCNTYKDTAAIDCLVSRINSDGCTSAACDGWQRTISAQKSYSKPLVAGGLVNFTSFEPTSTPCSLGGNTHLWALHYTTGTAYVQPTIFLAGGTGGATTSLEIKASVNLGIGVPPLGESLVALPLEGDTYKVITQVSGGLSFTSMAPSLPAKSRYVLWIVK